MSNHSDMYNHFRKMDKLREIAKSKSEKLRFAELQRLAQTVGLSGADRKEYLLLQIKGSNT